MKRVLMGALWFLVFWIGTSLALGMIVVVTSPLETPPTVTSGEHSPSKAYAEGYALGAAVHKRIHAKVILFGALLVAVAGTATGVLPGTRRRKDKDDASSREG